MIKADVNTAKFLKDLAKIHGGMHQATARTVNDMAEKTRSRYNKALKSEFDVRTKFTLNALKIFPASFERKSKPGHLRPLRDINALMVIRNLKGKTHYLVIQEEGLQKEKHKSADDKVSIPIAATSRKGGTSAGKVAPKFGLRKATPASLLLGGAQFGTARDGYTDKQRWAILNQRSDQWDLRKPFFFTFGENTDVYAKKGKKIVTIRQARDERRKVKKRPLFEREFDGISESEMQAMFNTVAGRILR